MIEAWNAVGLRVEIVVDRGFDVFRAEYQGRPLSWQGPPGMRSRFSYEPQGWGWLRNFQGGLLVTCGLEHVLMPVDRSSPEYRFLPDMPRHLGLHGRVANEAGEILERQLVQVEGEPVLRIVGRVIQAALYHERLWMLRTIEIPVFEPEIRIHDVVRNVGHYETHHELLYHINLGYPLVDAGAEVRIASKSGEEMIRITDPVPGFVEQVTGHDMARSPDGRAAVELVNVPAGRSLKLDYTADRLPYFYVWHMVDEGVYAIGFEPSTSKRSDGNEEPSLSYLRPNEEAEYDLRFRVS